MLKRVSGQKSVDMSGNTIQVCMEQDLVGVSDCNKVYKEAGNEAVMSISVDDCIDLDGMERSILAKTSKALKEIFLEFKDVSHDFIPDERCVWIDLVGLPLATWAPKVYKKLGGRWGSSVFTDMVSDGPMSHGKDYRTDIRGVESDLVDSFEEGVIRDDLVLDNDGLY
ncbi:hypothetical protein Tco_0449696 [Tanacetum coccineum]